MVCSDPIVKAYIEEILNKHRHIKIVEPSEISDCLVIEKKTITKSEKEILRLLIELGDIDEIAKARKRSKYTVRNQLSLLRYKLGAKNNLRLLSLAIKLGLHKTEKTADGGD